MDQFVTRFPPLDAICNAIQEGEFGLAAGIIDNIDQNLLRRIPADRIGQSPVMLAISVGHPKLAARLVEAGYQPDLWESAALNLPGTVRAFAERNEPRLDLCDAEGWAPAHLACYARSTMALAVLFEFDADPNVVACNSSLETPLHSAIRVDDPELISELLAAGADPRFADGFGRAPLQLAVEIGSANAWMHLADSMIKNQASV